MARCTLAPKMQSLREQYGDDRQKMSQAMMEMYKEEDQSWAAAPILVQMPVFLALYWVLLESVEMRQAPWMFWIHRPVDPKDPPCRSSWARAMFIPADLNPTPRTPCRPK